MIYIILGTTAEYIKMFPVMKLFDQNKIDYILAYTGQHHNLIDKDTKKLHFRKPDIYLTSQKNNLVNIRKFVLWIFKVLLSGTKLPIKKNDYVIVHGDAISTLLGLIIGKLHRAKVAHVEAGKRTFNLLSPFPEEIIRIIVSRFADILFPTSEREAKNIGKKGNIYLTHGNTVFDSVRAALKIKPSLEIEKIGRTQHVLFLIHRQENIYFKKNLARVLEILEIILKKKFRVIWSMHLNTQHELKAKGFWSKISDLKKEYNLEITPLLNYVDFIHAVKSSIFVASDAGGVQDETYLMNRPMLILRKATENLGIGETAYLANFEKEKVNYFLSNIKQFKRKTKIQGSPSKVVLDFFKKNYHEN